MDEYYIAVFESTNHALRFEKVIKGGGFDINVMPVPREITVSCGISAKIKTGDIEGVMELAVAKDLKISGYYHVELQNGKKSYSKAI